MNSRAPRVHKYFVEDGMTMPAIKDQINYQFPLTPDANACTEEEDEGGGGGGE